MKILVADKLDPRHFDVLDGSGIEVVDRSGIEPGDLLTEIADYDALVVRSRTMVDADVLKAGKRLKVVGRAGTGVDNVDVETATRQGVLVMNTPGANSNSAAEHAIGMMMALSRNIAAADASLKHGEDRKSSFTGVEVSGKVLAVVGLGRIGLLVSRKAKGLGMRVLGVDPVVAPQVARKYGVETTDLDTALAEADFVTLHVPLIEETRHMINRDRIAGMKAGVRIVNCARGGVVDEEALATALNEGQVAGAALDVFETEPPVGSPLLEMENVIATPHLGASTIEAQDVVARNILTQIEGFLSRGEVRGAVNGLVVDDTSREVVGPYLELAEKLGRIMAGAHQASGRLTARYYGTVASVDSKPMTVHFLKGYLSHFLGSEVNEVNAYALAVERGMVIEEVRRDTHRSFQALLYFTLGEEDDQMSLAGTLFGKNNLRIVRWGRHNLDAVPEGWLLVIENEDRPGMIGTIGAALGEAGVNIANMSLAREAGERTALCVLNLDDQPPSSMMASLHRIAGVVSVKLIKAGN